MSALRARLARLVVVRVGAATLLLGLALALRAAGSALWPFDRALLAVAGLYGIALLDAITARFADRFEQTADLHFALDTLLIAGFVVATGGVSSVFTPLLALPVVAAAGVQYRYGSLRMAAFASACLLLTVTWQYTRVRRPTGRCCRRPTSPGSPSGPTCSRSSPWRSWPASWPRTCGAPTSWSRRRRRRSPTSRLSTATSSITWPAGC